MPSLSRARLPLALLFGFALASLLTLRGAAWAADAAKKEKNEEKGETQKYPIKTGDGVELRGTFYRPMGTKKDAVILLLHDFDRVKGGNSHHEGIVALARELQKNGYPVLTFDFRGFGDSKNVTEKFWLRPENKAALRRMPAKPPETIDQKDFAADYYYSLVNDIAAAKASLERKNDAGEVNAGNVVVVGVGQGATLGALWMASEFSRKKALKLDLLGQPAKLDDEPEGKDLAGAILISPTPRLNGRSVPLKDWIKDIAGKKNKVPVAFVHGAGDAATANLSSAYIKMLGRDKSEYTGRRVVEGVNLVGTNLLLAKNKYVPKWVAKSYLDKLLDKRGSREWRRRKTADFAYYWTIGPRGLIQAKAANEDAPGPLPVKAFLNGR